MQFNTFIGIDPGRSGAIAVINNQMECVTEDFKEGVVPDLLVNASLFDRSCALIERVHAIQGASNTSVFKFGTNFGTWIGRLEALHIPYGFVAPGVWQKSMFKTAPKRTKKGKNDTKTMSLEVARRLFPTIANSHLLRKKDHGRSDAILIAEYLRRKGGVM